MNGVLYDVLYHRVSYDYNKGASLKVGQSANWQGDYRNMKQLAVFQFLI